MTTLLPSWASVGSFQPYDNVEDDEVLVEEEEPYLCTRVFRVCSTRVDVAVDASLRDFTVPLAHQIQAFFQAHWPEAPKHNGLTTPQKRKSTGKPKTPREELRDLELNDLLRMDTQEEEEENTNNEEFILEPNEKYSALALPVAVVTSPSSILDRRLVQQSLARCCAGMNHRPAVCLLEEDVSIQQVLEQCVEQEPNPRVFAKIVKQQKGFFVEESLLRWASHTVSFESLIILVSSDNISESFMQSLTTLRCQRGLPVHLIMLQDPDFETSTEGMMGMNILHCSMPRTEILYERVWEFLFLDPNDQIRLPVLLPPKVIECIHENFVNHTCSLVRAAVMMKQALANHFQYTGPFFCATACHDLFQQEWRRLAWFCVNRHAKNVLFDKDNVHGSTIGEWLDEVKQARRDLVMGDMPYNQVQKTLLEQQVLNLANSTAVLAVHVGDMMGHAAECSILFLQDVSTILQTLPMLTLVLAGDNDFYDCPDPARAWNNHVDTFVPFEQHWQDDHLLWEKIQRNPTRPTHVSVVHEGILLVTIDIWQGNVGAANEEENIAWVTDQVETAFASHAIRGVILLGHAQRERTIRPFFERFAALFYNVDTNLYVREVPVLYIHGDGHVWKIDTTFSEQLNWDLFVDLQVDQGEKAPPIALQIAEGFVDDPNFVPLVPETNQQYVLGRGLFRVDRGTGAY